MDTLKSAFCFSCKLKVNYCAVNSYGTLMSMTQRSGFAAGIFVERQAPKCSIILFKIRKQPSCVRRCFLPKNQS